MRLEDVYPTGEYRAPKKGELYVSSLNNETIILCSDDEDSGYLRIIVKDAHPERSPVRYLPEGDPRLHEDLEQTIAREESQEIEADAREAALLALTKIVLDEDSSLRDRRLAAKLILEHT